MEFMFDRLAALAIQARSGAQWKEDVLRLCDAKHRAGKSLEENGAMLVEAARLLRADRRIGTEAFVYVVLWVAETVVEPAIAAMFRRTYMTRFDAIRRAHRLDETREFPVGREPTEYLALAEEFEHHISRLTAEAIRHLGEPTLAESYERDRAGVVRVKDLGRLTLFGDTWLPQSLTS